MKIKYKSVNMRDFIGDMYGWIMFKKSGFEKAFYVWDADTVGDDPENADTVLLKKDYLSIRAVNHDFKYITAIAEHLWGEPYGFNIAVDEVGLVTVTRKKERKMSKLEELVPPLELCKLIPQGEFEDSCFAWSYSCDKRNTEPFVDYREDIEFCRRNMANAPDVYPAPTLEEIMKKLPIDTTFGKEQHGEIWVVYSHNRKYACQEQKGATAALKIWLRLKGFEYV